jgi:hypothetical protein
MVKDFNEVLLPAKIGQPLMVVLAAKAGILRVKCVSKNDTTGSDSNR